MFQDKIVAHYQNGRLIKGLTSNFVPNKDFFHLIPMDSPPDSKLMELRTDGLKGLFFVKKYSFIRNELCFLKKLKIPDSSRVSR